MCKIIHGQVSSSRPLGGCLLLREVLNRELARSTAYDKRSPRWKISTVVIVARISINCPVSMYGTL